MEELYDDIRKRLKAEVAALKYIDSDEGQIDYYDKFMLPSWPAALIDLNNIEWESCPDDQTGLVEMQIRVCFRMPEQTSSLVDNIGAAKTRIAILNSIHTALDNWSGSGASYTGLLRIRTSREKRTDPIKVFQVVYRTYLEG